MNSIVYDIISYGALIIAALVAVVGVYCWISCFLNDDNENNIVDKEEDIK